MKRNLFQRRSTGEDELRLVRLFLALVVISLLFGVCGLAEWFLGVGHQVRNITSITFGAITLVIVPAAAFWWYKCLVGPPSVHHEAFMMQLRQSIKHGRNYSPDFWTDGAIRHPDDWGFVPWIEKP